MTRSKTYHTVIEIDMKSHGIFLFCSRIISEEWNSKPR